MLCNALFSERIFPAGNFSIIKKVATLNTGIEVLETADRNFSIFPNPASSEVTFSFQTKPSEKWVLTIFNMNGQITAQKNLDNLPQGENRIKIDVTGFENGIYSCRLTNNEKINVIRKFIISH